MSPSIALLTLITSLSPAPPHAVIGAVDGTMPIFMTPSDSSPIPGEIMSYTVTLSAPASMAGSLAISSTTSSNFSSLPSHVAFNAGDSAVTFSVTVSSSASGSLEASALASGGSVSSIVMVTSQATTFRF